MSEYGKSLFSYNGPSELKVPDRWQLVMVKELGEVVTGSTPSKQRDEFFGGSVPFFKPTDLNEGYNVRKYSDSLTNEGAKHARILPPNSVLVTCIGATIGKTGLARVACATNQQINALIAKGAYVLPEWCYWAFCSSYGQEQITSNASATTLPILNKRNFERLHLPLAPLNEQRRIVAKIEELFSDLDAGVAALTRAKANLKRYRASVLKAAVEGHLTAAWRAEHPNTEPASKLIERVQIPPRPNRWSTRSKDIIPGHAALSVGMTNSDLPNGWTWTPLVDVARMETGHTPSRRHPEWWDGEIAWIGIADAREHHGGTILETVQHTNQDGLANSAARLLPQGTVCISRTASVGYVVVMGRPMATSQDFVNWVPTECVSSDWLRVIFTADREALLRFGKGSVHKTIYFPEWLSTCIAVPPIEEQRQIVRIVDEKLSQITAAEKDVYHSLIRAARLRQSILKQAFEGKLVPQDPADEPASVLLERIREAPPAAAIGNGKMAGKRARRAQAT